MPGGNITGTRNRPQTFPSPSKTTLMSMGAFTNLQLKTAHSLPSSLSVLAPVSRTNSPTRSVRAVHVCFNFSSGIASRMAPSKRPATDV